jgi:phosphoribosylformylglycinamidine synthase subunit PurQ / glutaminase
MSARIALLRFPGVNCEEETSLALQQLGARVEWVELGEPLEDTRYDGFVLPGGFSYEDRVRAGAVAARSEWMRALARADEQGKPVLGICNGAQVLVEAGLVPGGAGNPVRLALARNSGAGRGGYLCRWVFTRVTRSACDWLLPLEGMVCPMPVAHAEGRFVTQDPGIAAGLVSGGLCAARYVAPDGGPPGPDWDPNGSLGAAAAVCGFSGNAVAWMPHPERAAWLRQVPEEISGPWGEERRAVRAAARLAVPGPGLAVLEAFVAGARAGVRA